MGTCSAEHSTGLVQYSIMLVYKYVYTVKPV